ncbi:tyrosine-protein phosphatase [Nocardia miyunensis]|uniref:tyrosine-protein phosphatase n=1 Tax=Nocardia miyunensis TaxID=282684 RepID=UPI0008340A8D|nr:tyrosine-protein phosphatase [Nocardia miyunensis]
MVHRSIRVVAALAAGTAIGLGPAVGSALAADPPPATTAVVDTTVQRAVPLQGVLNARDIGGYRTADGRTVRTGLVYRTGALAKATNADLTALTTRKVRAIHDLRTSYERMLSPDRVPAGAIETWNDVIGQASPQALVSSLSAGPDMYRAFITAPGASEAFAAVLHDIARTSDGAVLYHCSEGKDRTGWTSAVLLTALGVDRETVDYDYLLSNYYRDARDGDMANGVAQSELDAAFDQVDESYGNFDNYLHQGLQLSNADISALKTKLLH